MDNILYQRLNLRSLPTDIIVHELEGIEEKCWFFDDYRKTWMLPIMTDSGEVSKVGSLNKGGAITWTKYATPSLKFHLEQFVLPKLLVRGRIMILRTFPNEENQEHIDCSPKDFLSPQYKIRSVLCGEVDHLYFVCQDGVHLRPKGVLPGGFFVMDGRWPHGMRNQSALLRYTLCIGSPWNGQGLEPLLNRSDENNFLLWNPGLLPDNYETFFETEEARRKKLCS